MQLKKKHEKAEDKNQRLLYTRQILDLMGSLVITGPLSLTPHSV